MSSYPPNGNEYNDKSNVNQNQSYPHQTNPGYMGQQNPNYPPSYNYPPSAFEGQQQHYPPPPHQPQLPVLPQVPYYGGPSVYLPLPTPCPVPPPVLPPTHVYPHPPTAPLPPPQQSIGYCSQMQKSKPQQNALAAASMILTSGGMSFAWGNGFGPTWGITSKDEHLTLSWFVGVIIGAFICALLIKNVGKKIIYYIGSVLVIIGGILFTSCPLNITAILFARYMDGVANGLALIALLSSGGELAVKEIRGMVVSIEKLSFSVGFMIQSSYGFFDFDLNATYTNQFHGGFAILYGCLAILFNLIFTIESPVYHLCHNNESAAHEEQNRLLGRYVHRDQLSYSYIEEHKRLIEDDASRSRTENITSSIMPIIKLIILRSIVGLTMSYPINFLYIVVYFIRHRSIYGMFYYGFLRFFGNMLSIFFIDKIGRKKLSFVSLIVSGALMFAIGGVYDSTSYTPVASIIPLLIVFQFFVGLGLEPTSSVYLSEAFSLSVKPFAIFAVIFFENLIQIITVVISLNNVIDYSGLCYAMGSFMFFLFFIFVVALPETKGLALLLCRQQFLKNMHR